MKNLSRLPFLGILLLTILLISSCEKEEAVEGVYNPNTCDNGVKDYDELGIDCGNSCGPCDLILPSCEIFLDDNKFYGNNTSVILNEMNISVNNGRTYVRIGNPQGDSIKFVFDTDNLVYYKDYTPSSLESLDASKVYVEATVHSLPYTMNTQEIYTFKTTDESASEELEKRVALNIYNLNDETIMLTFCELEMYESTQGGTFNFEGNFFE